VNESCAKDAGVRVQRAAAEQLPFEDRLIDEAYSRRLGL
jgi:hypothetical protein